MKHPPGSVIWLLLALSAVAACAPPASTQGPPGAEGPSTTGPKRITAAVLSDVPSLAPGSGPQPGREEIAALLNVGLTGADDQGAQRPFLAQEVPSTENGLWKIFPDGSMETTWILKPGLLWHDGVPFSTEDVLFTERVTQDKELALAADPANRLIEGIDAPDARTITVKWKQPYIWADKRFSGDPWPRHLLERPFAENKETFLALAYWTQEFVGTGGYRMKEWARSSYVLLEVNEQYVMGRPKIDQMEIRFIPDSNALVTSILAGTVELGLSRGIALDQALLLREQWKDGRVAWTPGLAILMYPQLLPPTPPAMGDPRFRRALLHAIDRQELVDTLMHGLSGVAHATVLNPRQQEYQQAEQSIVRYDYDPRKAAQSIEEMGFARGPDGFYRDAATSERLVVGMYSSPSNTEKVRALYAVADSWQRIGINVEPSIFSIAQVNDNQWLSTRPGFYHVRHPHSLLNLEAYWHSSQARLPETQFRGSNYTRYMNAELDALIERFNATIPTAERVPVLRSIVRHITEQVLVLGLFYDGETSAVARRIKNVSDNEGADKLWNVHEWDVD